MIARPEQAGLLLTTIATFCTTDPPANSTLLPYTRNATYTLLLASLALSLGGLIVSSTTVFIMARCNSYLRTHPIFFPCFCVVDAFATDSNRFKGQVGGDVDYLGIPFY